MKDVIVQIQTGNENQYMEKSLGYTSIHTSQS